MSCKDGFKLFPVIFWLTKCETVPSSTNCWASSRLSSLRSSPMVSLVSFGYSKPSSTRWCTGAEQLILVGVCAGSLNPRRTWFQNKKMTAMSCLNIFIIVFAAVVMGCGEFCDQRNGASMLIRRFRIVRFYRWYRGWIPVWRVWLALQLCFESIEACRVIYQRSNSAILHSNQLMPECAEESDSEMSRMQSIQSVA